MELKLLGDERDFGGVNSQETVFDLPQSSGRNAKALSELLAREIGAKSFVASARFFACQMNATSDLALPINGRTRASPWPLEDRGLRFAGRGRSKHLASPSDTNMDTQNGFIECIWIGLFPKIGNYS